MGVCGTPRADGAAFVWPVVVSGIIAVDLGGTNLRAAIAAGIVVAVLYTLGGLVVLARPVVAALLFVLAAAVGFLFGREDGSEGLAVYGVVALLLAAASGVCARWRQVPWVTNGRGG